MATDDFVKVVEQNDEVVEEIAEMCEELFGGDSDVDEMADDAFMRFIQEAGEKCGLAGIEREHRPDVIMAGIRLQNERQLEQSLQDIRWQVELMYGL